jgi:large subunit ribosomal protein L25
MILNATLRQQTGKAVAELREAGKIPAVLYGHGTENKNLTLEQAEFEKVLREAGESTLIDLKVDGSEPTKVLIQDFQRNPVKHQIIHADLHQVRMDEKIKTDVEIEFINESPAVKDLGGSLIKTMDKIEIECLPGDLISNITVDLSNLKKIGDSIRVKDLNLGDKISILIEVEAPLVLVEEPKKVEEEVVAPKEEEGEKSAESEKKEGEAGVEGEKSEEVKTK